VSADQDPRARARARAPADIGSSGSKKHFLLQVVSPPHAAGLPLPQQGAVVEQAELGGRDKTALRLKLKARGSFFSPKARGSCKTARYVWEGNGA